MFIEVIEMQAAGEDTRAMYAAETAHWGMVPDYTRLFCYRPEVMQAWGNLQQVIKTHVDRRTFELVTYAAATAIRSSCCSTAHGSRLRSYLADDAIVAIAKGDGYILNHTDEVLVKFAKKVVTRAFTTTQQDVRELQDCGLTDAQIFDVAAIAAARAFFANLIESLGVSPDPDQFGLPPELQAELAVGRPVK